MLAGVFNRGCPPQERSFHAAGPEVVLADASNEHLRPNCWNQENDQSEGDPWSRRLLSHDLFTVANNRLIDSFSRGSIDDPDLSEYAKFSLVPP
jgi:hypothetical protein